MLHPDDFFGSAVRGQAILLVLSGRLLSMMSSSLLCVKKRLSTLLEAVAVQEPQSPWGRKEVRRRRWIPRLVVESAFLGPGRAGKPCGRPQPGKQQRKMKKRSGGPAQGFEAKKSLVSR